MSRYSFQICISGDDKAWISQSVMQKKTLDKERFFNVYRVRCYYDKYVINGFEREV